MDSPINISKRLERLTPETASNRVIGSGISFPFEFSNSGKTSSVSLSTGSEKINQSIHCILTTRPGERIMLPEYGSRLPYLVYEPADEILEQQLILETADALRRWERRITLNNVITLSPFTDHIGTMIRKGAPANIASSMAGKNWMGIVIDYTILRTHAQGSYVFPFESQSIPMSETVSRTFVSRGRSL